jgi:uncharacterized protein YecE (DUF72 family)
MAHRTRGGTPPRRIAPVDHMMAEVRIGTSGWSYPTAPGAWTGVFYPAGGRTAAGQKFDELAYYAEHFDTVEVNSSFYRPPAPSVTKSWVARTPPAFDFSVKLYQKFTHPAMYAKSAGHTKPEAHEAAVIPTVGAADVDIFRRAIDPLAEAGKLGALLAQFPPSFICTKPSMDYLQWLLGTFPDYPVAVELRHRSWSDRTDDTLGLLNEHAAAWVQIDEPKFRFSVRQDFAPNQRGIHYLRLHGRNADKWWKHDDPAERYNYLYSGTELGGFVDTIDAVRHLVKKIYLYLNNHFAAKAVANAAELRHGLGQRVTGDYSPEMLEHYPGLKDIVKAGPRTTLLDGL